MPIVSEVLSFPMDGFALQNKNHQRYKTNLIYTNIVLENIY